MAKKSSKTASTSKSATATKPPAAAASAASADTDTMMFVGKGDQPAFLTLALANRHGLVTGATGTGKNSHASGYGGRLRPCRGAGLCRGHQG
ncbi:MoxR-like ATPase [Nitrobacteraceae bacterium AZCC 1564]